MSHFFNHASIMGTIAISAVLGSVTERRAWTLRRTDWPELKPALSLHNGWKLRGASGEEALSYFSKIPWYLLRRITPHGKMNKLVRSTFLSLQKSDGPLGTNPGNAAYLNFLHFKLNSRFIPEGILIEIKKKME
jgi:hypothetical protein